MSHDLMSQMNESRLMYEWNISAAGAGGIHGPHRQIDGIIQQSRHTYEWVMSHDLISHMDESRLMYEWNISAAGAGGIRGRHRQNEECQPPWAGSTHWLPFVRRLGNCRLSRPDLLCTCVCTCVCVYMYLCMYPLRSLLFAEAKSIMHLCTMMWWIIADRWSKINHKSCTCIYIYIQIYIYLNQYTFVGWCVCICMCVHMYMYMYMYMYPSDNCHLSRLDLACTYVRWCVWSYVYVRVCVYICTCIWIRLKITVCRG